MISLFCKGNHKSGKQICKECEELKQYAETRLEKCPEKNKKPPCSKCSTHCYRPEMREKVRIVMRYSGPRMLLHHPIMAIDHLIKTIK